MICPFCKKEFSNKVIKTHMQRCEKKPIIEAKKVAPKKPVAKKGKK